MQASVRSAIYVSRLHNSDLAGVVLRGAGGALALVESFWGKAWIACCSLEAPAISKADPLVSRPCATACESHSL